MNIRNVLFFTLISLSSLQSYGMNESSNKQNSSLSPLPTNPTPHGGRNLKRLSENNLFPAHPDKKARTESPQRSEPLPALQTSPFLSNIKKSICDIDPVALENLLASDETVQLMREEKEDLYKTAKERKQLIKTINNAANKLASQTDNQAIKTKFSYDSEYKNIQKITRNLYAFKTLPKLTFPQVFFTNTPYCPTVNLKPTPDQVLLTLIKNEQEKISVCCFHITLESIAQALVHKKNKGISVEVITNHKQGDSTNTTPNPNKEIDYLIENKIPLWWPKNKHAEQMHQKTFVFNRNILNKPLVVTGSYNPTPYSNLNSWDDLMVLEDPDMIAQYQQRLENIKERSQTLLNK